MGKTISVAFFLLCAGFGSVGTEKRRNDQKGGVNSLEDK